MIGKRIPDLSAMKNLIEKGYEIFGSAPNIEAWWPVYIWKEYDEQDFLKSHKWPDYIHHQRIRTNKFLWSSPDNTCYKTDPS